MKKTSTDTRQRATHPSHKSLHVSRRTFLRVLGMTASGLMVAGCQPGGATARSDPSQASPTAPQSTAQPASTVAIARAETYDPKLIRQKVQEMLDGLGGLGDVIHTGDRVAIKINLTGGAYSGGIRGIPPVETHATHPQVVQAIGECALDAGAKEITIVEAIWDQPSYSAWGYPAVQKALNAAVVDLNQAKPYADFASVPVGKSWYIYEAFMLNRILSEVDVFISVAKMKCHYLCGVTLSMKNLVGLVPDKRYKVNEKDDHRTALHGPDSEVKTRLPRVVMDLNRARPIHFSLIDGIKTVEGGEGPWMKISPVEPGVLVAGKNPVATDAVATAVMGFDPAAVAPNRPFLRCDNHLTLAAECGLGTNQLSGIKVIGTPVADVVHPFKPSDG